MREWKSGKVLAGIAASLIGFSAVSASASISAIHIEGIPGHEPPYFNDQTVGWEFDVLDTILVNRLAFYDMGADGLRDSHMVGIWNPDGSLAASVEIPAGTAAQIDSGWRYIEIAPIELAPEAGYVIGAESFRSSDRFFGEDVRIISIMPQIEYVSARFANPGTGFTRPGRTSVGDLGFFGPGFFVVPAPSGLGLLMIGGIVTLRRKRSHPERARFSHRIGVSACVEITRGEV